MKESRDRWFAVFCKPRREAVAEENLLRQEYCVYFPRICVRQRQRGQWVDVIEALFPRYVFIRLDPLLRSTSTVRSTRGVVGLVRFGGLPAVVPDAAMDSLIRRAGANSGLHDPFESQRFDSGDPIRVVDGPLSGMEGVFAQRDGEKRVVVLLDLLGKANQIRVNRDWIVHAA